MKQNKIIGFMCALSLLTVQPTKPFSAAATATGITAGCLGAAAILVWNLELEPKSKSEKSSGNQPIIAKNRFAQFVQTHKKTIINVTRAIAGGFAIGFIGYQAHPIIAAIFKTIPDKKNQPHLTDAEKAFELFGLPKTASKEQLKEKYKELVKLYHPDKYRNPEQCIRIFGRNLTDKEKQEREEKFKEIGKAKNLLDNILPSKPGSADPKPQNPDPNITTNASDVD